MAFRFHSLRTLARLIDAGQQRSYRACLVSWKWHPESKASAPTLQFVVARHKQTSSATNQGVSEMLLDSEFTIKQLAKKIKLKPGKILSLLQELGQDTEDGVNTVLGLDVTEFILLEHGIKPVFPDVGVVTQTDVSRVEGSGQPRPPVVTIMGHVDHGKTTLLDTLRNSAVAKGEAGGITQHVGAFSVEVSPGKTVTFIDTPGHAAFNAMRSRGAKVTDQVILMVAADDGIQEQTVECISHAKTANVPILVAINKIDRSNANVERVKNQLLVHGLQLEEQGGDVAAVEISALKNLNLDKLLDVILTHAELSDLRADCTAPVKAVVLESHTDKRTGSTATVLVQQGTLRKGSYLVAGSVFAKVRQLFDDQGRPVPTASPSQPVRVLGWRNLPEPGDVVTQHETEADAKLAVHAQKIRDRLQQGDNAPLDVAQPAEERVLNSRGRKIPMRIINRRKQASSHHVIDGNDQKPKVSVIIKADVSGSLEALINTLASFKSEFVDLEIVSASVGAVVASDIQMAEAIGAVVYAFNVPTAKEIEGMATQNGVPLRGHDIIYHLLSDCKLELSSKLPLVKEEVLLGEAHVLKVFTLTGQRKGTVAGCRVKEGMLARRAHVVWRVVRDGEIVHEGSLKSLKRGMEDTSEARKEMECGVSLENYSRYQEGDHIQCVQVTERKQELDWSSW